MRLFTYIFFLLFLATCGGGGGGASSPTGPETSSILSQTHHVEVYKEKTLDLIASSLNGETISFAVSSNPNNGQVAISGNQLTYTPNNGYVGIDNFNITASSSSDSKIISISVDVFYNPYKDYQLTNVTLRNGILFDPDEIDGSYGIYDCKFNGVDREFLLYTPNGINPYNSNELPVLFYFHGYSSDMDPYYKIESIERLREVGKFIHVRPQGLTGPVPGQDGTWGNVTGWNYLYPDIRDENDDIGFINALINYVHDTQSISHEKIYIRGFSSGGRFSIVMASENELIDGVQSMGSIMHTYYTYEYEQPIKFQVLKGTADEWDPYEYSDEHDTFWGVEEGMMHLISQYSCSDTSRVNIPDIDGDGKGGERLYTTDCTDGSTFEAFKLIDEAHIQFWGNRPLGGHAPWSSDVDVFELLQEMIN
jgi:poly(3-hydroxybutyrate) depolymerase